MLGPDSRLAARQRCGVAVAALLVVADAGEDSIGDEALLDASVNGPNRDRGFL